MIWDVFWQATTGYGRYLWQEVTDPHWGNYFYWLIAISLATYLLELWFPWRQTQSKVRKDFWLDAFYMFFNFFLFGLVGFAGASEVAVLGFQNLLALAGVENMVAIRISSWPTWLQWFTLFLIRDFIHFNVHRLLHRWDLLWRFHQVHHSVKEMGFAAHLRYHWMENVFYKSLEYIPLAMIGFGIDDFLWVHLFSLAIGHLNHANVAIPLGPLKYILNHATMHIWHHAKDLPPKRRFGVNFGISLSCWDFIFGTDYIPKDGRDIELGFDGDEAFQTGFMGHSVKPFRGSKNG